MTRAGARVDWERVELAYEVYAEEFDIDQMPTQEQARAVAKVLLEHGHNVRPGVVRRWLTDRRAFSPYVDEVAMERVMNDRDWDNLDSLTDREHHVLLERLVTVVDRQMRYDRRLPVPFDDVPWKAVGRDGVSMYDLEGSRFASENNGRRFLASTTPRRMARVEFPDHHPLRAAIDKRRWRRDRAQAAAA